MLKKYLKLKTKKKILRWIVKGLTFLFTSTMGLFSVIAIAITFFIIGVSEINNSGADLESGGVPKEYIEYFNQASEVFNIPNWCLAAVAKQESNFNPNSSYKGAYGIMQIQKVDPSTGKDLWLYLINNSLGAVYKSNGYSFSDSEEMWNIFLNDPKAQIYAGAYEIRYYANYVLYKKGYINKLDYNNNENMNLIDWNSEENNYEFRELLRRIFACYNGGPGYGMSVDLDNAQNDYPNKVFNYAMEFRSNGINGSGQVGDNETIEKAIEAGVKWVGKSPYVWGGGRTQADVDAGRFDCSSFVHYCFAEGGIQLGKRESVVTDSLVVMGEKININEIKRGDLIFFDTYKTNGHVGIWLGDNKFLHDGTSTGVTISEFKGYYVDKFNGVIRRVVKTN